MSTTINTNVAAQNSIRHLSNNNRKVGKSIEKLASGKRINRAADDAAGLAISEKLRVAIRGRRVAKRNSMDAISLVQTAEGTLNEVGNMLSRMKELSVQASSDTIGPRERSFLQLEYGQLSREIDRIANATDFNGMQLLTGSAAKVEGRVEFQSGINNNPDIDRLSFKPEEFDVRMTALGLNSSQIDVKSDAQSTISKLDGAINHVSKMRAKLGALQNRMGHVIQNLEITTENNEAAKSRIRDTEYAEEASKLITGTTVRDSNAAVLIQANSKPEVALRLLS